jgi:glycine oxidase
VSGPLVVVGGGIIGLSVAWRAAAAGRDVTVIDPSPGQGSSWVAAGMLAPVTEARAAEAPLARLGLDSLARWVGFAEELAADSGLASTDDLGLRREGTLEVAFDEGDRRELAELAEVHRLLGLRSEPLSGRQSREVVPLLSPRVRAGLFVEGDWQADPRRVVAALEKALVERGGRLVTDAATRVVTSAGGRVAGVETAGGVNIEATDVVVATGAGGTPLDLPGGVSFPVRPVKGEILRLRTDPADPPLPLTVRAAVQGRPVYLVPRHDGEIVVGATVQEAGFDRSVRAGAVHDLLRSATDLVPALGEAGLEETSAGLRPGTPDNGPILGPTTVPGLYAALGHFRNGVLLAPVTADALLEAVTTGAVTGPAAGFGPGRFA